MKFYPHLGGHIEAVELRWSRFPSPPPTEHESQRFEQVRLTRVVGADDNHEVLVIGEVDAGRLRAEAPEVRHLDVREAHSRSLTRSVMVWQTSWLGDRGSASAGTRG